MAEMHRRATFRNSYTEAMEQAQAQLNRMREHELAQRKEFHDRYIRLMEHWPAARLLTDHPRTVRLVTQSFDEQLPVMDVEWLEEVREQLREVLEQHEYTTPYPDLQQGQRLLHPRVSGTDTPPSTARPTNGPSEVFSSSVPEASVQDEGLLSPIAEADSSPHSPSPAYSRDDRSPPSTDADTVAQLHQAQSQVASLQAQLEVLQEKYEDSRRLAEAAQDELTRSVLQYSIAPAAMSSDNLPETAMQQGPNKLAQNDEENATSDVDAAGQDEASLALRSNKASKSTLQPEATDADATSREIEVSVPVFASARSDSLDLAVADDGDGDGDEDHLSDDDDASDAVAVSSVASASGEERHPVVEASAASASSAPGHAAEQKDLAPVSAALSPSYQRVKLAIYDFEVCRSLLRLSLAAITAVGDTVLFMAQNHSIEYMKAFRRSKDDGSEPIECILTQRQMVVHGALRQT
ncbi:uncharacterized protein MONBRDRAFT_23199 [Monosiga brevicollis MX1]|uniref:Uncharacterized protein n=1 Tax=Monosiga brevicollis TaxID=81824 RepID=A9URG8_MONBE|nr:uncharacterized protein MONBRDRAFT_23199 [Monosiga brevicollis MX1]EDQ91920.1 predicted protein [Monosiga brevicollis MX1]|eukprot:XP_001743206.1 hypothetical protein [Monosiga brevicollis MX1]